MAFTMFWVMEAIGFFIGFFYPFSGKNINSHQSGVGLQKVFLGEIQTIKVIFLEGLSGALSVLQDWEQQR
jgi:hypothetical protein